ncbi:MAG: flagellar hook-associated protein FlgL [Candidatus Brocadiaceae bacterium]|nr:flagellar hook-associated protein FlgL [Candidatus Brocadiaceae bacterium]
MSSRITQNSINRTTLSNIKLNYKEMQEIQEKLSTGKRLNRPSDDPSGMRKVLGFKTEKIRVQQFLDNASIASEQIIFTFNSLENIQSAVERVQTLALEAGNDTLGVDERTIIASEIDGFLETILQFSNMTDSNGRYIYSGTKTLTETFSATRNSTGEISSVSYNGNSEELEQQIGPNSYVKVNKSGDKLFLNNNLFSTLVSMRDELKSSSYSSNTFLSLRGALETAANSLMSEMTKFGATANRLEISISRLESSKLSLKELISYSEDADIAELIMELKNQENVLQSSLQTGARIIQPTLLDFLG